MSRLRGQVKRNSKRFPADFMFQLTVGETDAMVSQNAIPSKKVLVGALSDIFTERERSAVYVKLLDSTTKSYDTICSTPAKPLLCMLNSGGFFIAQIDGGVYAV